MKTHSYLPLKTILVFLTTTILVHAATEVYPHDKMKSPWTTMPVEKYEAQTGSQDRSGLPAVAYLFHIYKHYISPVDGDNRCSFYPSCSEYAEQAIQKHGLLPGLLMTCDRLQRCGHDRGVRVIVNNNRVIYDPISNNDFWWKKEKTQ